ncbi:MAG: sigma-70 family RNA polymerase sigma factor [Chloroflexales bacterium]|jgi:RNA polymerase sigma factor (sigma-70 family)
MNQGDALLMFAALNAEHGWELSAADVERYALALCILLPDTCPETVLRRVCVYYHADHQLVEALRNNHDPNHNESWIMWAGQVCEILRKAGLSWSSDSAVDSDDLVQVAQMAIMISLPSFAYRSSFVTWAHAVIIQSVRRHIRDSRAKKRAQRPDSLDSTPDGATPVHDEEGPEQQVLTKILIDQTHAVILQARDERMALIFHLWAVEDRSTKEIGTLVHLHPSRVRALLALTRTLLLQHPAIQTWLTDTDISSHT